MAYNTFVDYNLLTQETIISKWDILRKPFVCRYFTLQPDTIEVLKHKLPWHIVSEYQTLSNQQMINYIDLIDWKIALQYQNIDLSLFPPDNKIFWLAVSKNDNIRDKDIQKYHDRLNFDAISFYKNSFSNDLLIEFEHKLDFNVLNKRFGINKLTKLEKLQHKVNKLYE